VLPGPPHQGIGRGFKVGKEEVVGLVTALKRYAAADHEAEQVRWEQIIHTVLADLADLPHVHGDYRCPPDHPVPLAVLALDEAVLGFTTFTAIRRLLDGEPAIAVAESRARTGALVINPMSLKSEETTILVTRLRQVLTGNG
jgi:L-seryl-tRNA(Ser) seleniumtransferase